MSWIENCENCYRIYEETEHLRKSLCPLCKPEPVVTTANTFAGVSILKICPHCNATRMSDASDNTLRAIEELPELPDIKERQYQSYYYKELIKNYERERLLADRNWRK